MEKMDEAYRKELAEKYQWAGKIRFVSFLLLFIFLLLMKFGGGYSYLNITLVALIFVEAVFNQPYNFFLKRVNLFRFQFYQMTTDIIAISWVLYYLGGIEAPVVSIAYYTVILWAGVVSGPKAVFFAVSTSCFFFLGVVLFEHFGILPPVTYLNFKIPTTQMLSLLFGNVAFLFAFGYFSAHSSKVIKFLERKRQEESLKYTHRLLVTGYLLSGLAHDMINHLASIRGYATVLLERIKGGGEVADQGFNNTEALKSIERLESENIKLITRLSRFSQKTNEKRQLTDLNNLVEDALVLTLPLAKASDIAVETELGENLPLIMVDKDQIQEVLVTLILNSLDAIGKTGRVAIKTFYLPESNYVQMLLSDTGLGKRQDYLRKIVEPFFADKGEVEREGFGLAIAQEIVARHNGKFEIRSSPGEGTTVTIWLSLIEAEKPLV
jgi:signal transduction histidine kinase